MTYDEAVEVLETVCPCVRLDCDDYRHRALVDEATVVVSREVDGPPAWWDDEVPPPF